MKRVINRESMNPYDSSQVQSVLKGKAEIEPEWGKEAKRWKPEAGEKYFYIELGYYEGFLIDYDRWSEYDISNMRNYRLGNCFRTRKEAETKLKEIKKLLRGNNEND